MIKIYHNPRCSKSREALELIEKSGKDYTVIKYLEDIPSKKELKELISLLSIEPRQLLRENESIWKDNFKGKNLSDEQIIKIMIENPKLIERPIIVNGGKAVIGRPPENILKIV